VIAAIGVTLTVLRRGATAAEQVETVEPDFEEAEQFAEAA
jgi:hypothetical protein